MERVWTLLSFGPEGWGDDIAKGVLLTVSLALATLPLGLAIGFFVALGKRSSDKTLRLAANIYTTIFRGLPELLTLFLVFYGAQIGLQQIVRLFNPDNDGQYDDLNAMENAVEGPAPCGKVAAPATTAPGE